jgi:hypothetical protein
VAVSNLEVPQSGVFQLTHNISVPDPAKSSDEQSNIISESRGQKRKRDEAVGKAPKKRSSKGTKNPDTTSVTESEGKGISGVELKERAGKLTLSGHVPLMPSHLAEGGYQGEKRGIRGRNVQPAKKPKSRVIAQSRLQKGLQRYPERKKPIQSSEGTSL